MVEAASAANAVSVCQSHLTKTYSSTTVLVLIIGLILFDGFVYGPLTNGGPSTYDCVSLALRVSAIVCLGAVWLLKKDEDGLTAHTKSKLVPWFQAAFPLFAILALSAHMAKGLYLGVNSGPAAITAQTGLRAHDLKTVSPSYAGAFFTRFSDLTFGFSVCSSNCRRCRPSCPASSE
jgi:hypothetical protein